MGNRKRAQQARGGSGCDYQYSKRSSGGVEVSEDMLNGNEVPAIKPLLLELDPSSGNLSNNVFRTPEKGKVEKHLYLNIQDDPFRGH